MLSVRRLADPRHRIAHPTPQRPAVGFVRAAVGERLHPQRVALSPIPERIQAG